MNPVLAYFYPLSLFHNSGLIIFILCHKNGRPGRPYLCTLLEKEMKKHRVEVLRKVDPKEAMILMTNKAIKSSTLCQYRSRLKQILLFAEVADVEHLTLPLFAAFLAAIQGSVTSAEGFRSAVLHFQQAGGNEQPWVASPVARKIVEGFVYDGGLIKEKQQRGAITFAMVVELIAAAPGPLQLPIRVLFFTGLRKSEFLNMKKGDLKGRTLTVNANKALSRKTMGREGLTQTRELVMDEAISAIREAESHVVEGALLWKWGRLDKGGWNWGELSKFLSAQKDFFGWPPSLHFVPHSLRHGSVQHVCATLGSSENEKRVLGMSKGAQRIYLKKNEDRTAQAKKRVRPE